MTNTLVSPADLLDFGQFSDSLVDVAAASVRREAQWHIAPRRTEDVRVVLRGGERGEVVLPTRDFPDAPVVVNAVTSGGVAVAGWEQAEGVLVRRAGVWSGWRPYGAVLVNITHGFPTCPPDLLPVLAQRASAARSPRDSRVSAFANGAIQMAFMAPGQIDPTVAGYALIGGVA